MLYREEAITANPLKFDAQHIKATRTSPPKKINRLRISWFVLGALFGIGSSFATHLFFSNSAPAQLATAKPETILAVGEGAAAPAKTATAVTDAEPALDSAPQNPSLLTLTVSKGDTLSSLLGNKGVNYQETHNLITALRKSYDPRRLTIGQQVELQLNENKLSSPEADFDVAALRIRMTPVETLELVQNHKGDFSVNTLQAVLNTELKSGGGVINSSLYQTGVDTNVPATILGTLINAYSYDVDFQRDVKRGDQFSVVFEKMQTEEGVTAGYGKLLYATLTIGGQEKRIYHYTRASGEDGYYDETGQSVRKALLRTPINGARLSSGYGMRHHPILGYGKMHKGVDFAAPTGTPIYAAGDGVVDYSGRRGAYGNYVRIRHNNQYSTAYAHMNRIAQRARKGQRVKQGDVIGYVGTTGRSTGPHLHYEVLQNGTQVNPRNIKFSNGHKLAGQELASFREQTKQIDLIAARLVRGEPSVAQLQLP